MKLKLIVCLAAALTVACGSRTPEQTVEGLYRSVESGDRDKALRLLDPRGVQMLGADKIGSLLNANRLRYEQCGGIKSVKVELQGDDARQQGTATLTFNGSCPVRKEPVRLVFRDGEWRGAI